MVDKLLKIIAPHHCIDCKQIGSSLCVSCKEHIINEPFLRCLTCLAPSAGLCVSCRSSYDRACCVSYFDGPVKELVYSLKFENLREAATKLAELLDKTVDFIPSDTIVTYVPTLLSHIRQRGYDQSAIIAKKFAKIRDLKFDNTISRASKSRQRDSTAKQRWSQAKTAFAVDKPIKASTYLLIDDVVTTGASIEFAAKTLKQNGAKEVWVAAIARQTLD